MLRKCYYCDLKGEQTIETDTDDFLIVENKGYHTECYIKKLTKAKQKRHRKTKEEASQIVEHLKNTEMKEWILREQERKEKDSYFQYIMGYYDAKIPNNYFTRIEEVVKGTMKGLPHPISYNEMYEMYQNPRFRQLLERARRRKGIAHGADALFYDLAILTSEHDKYRKKKEQLKNNRLQTEQYIEIMKKYSSKTPKATTKLIEKEKTEFDDIRALADEIFG